MRHKKIHRFHPAIPMTPACRPHLTGVEFKASEHDSKVSCKLCISLIRSGWVQSVEMRLK